MSSKLELAPKQKELVRKLVLEKKKFNKRIPYTKLVKTREFSRFSVRDLKLVFNNELRNMEDEERRNQARSRRLEEIERKQKNELKKKQEVLTEAISKEVQRAKEEAEKLAAEKIRETKEKAKEEAEKLAAEKIRETKEKAEKLAQINAEKKMKAQSDHLDQYLRALKNSIYEKDSEMEKLRIAYERERAKVEEISSRATVESQRSKTEHEHLTNCVEHWQKQYVSLKQRVSSDQNYHKEYRQNERNDIYDELEHARDAIYSLRIATIIEAQIKDLVKAIKKQESAEGLSMKDMRIIIRNEVSYLRRNGAPYLFRENVSPNDFLYQNDISTNIKDWWEERCELAHTTNYVEKMNHRAFRITSNVVQDMIQQIWDARNF